MAAEMIEQQFRAAMADAGIHTNDEIIADGEIHRFDVDGDKRGSRNGWYVLHADGVPAGAFGSWRTDEQSSWCAKRTSELTPAERDQHRQRMEENQRIRDAERVKARADAAAAAEKEWNAATLEMGSHKYLVTKGVQAHGIRSNGHKLLIPMRDSDGKLWSLQKIWPDSDGRFQKRYFKDGAKEGCYFALGKPDGRLIIAEGYSTAASIFEATGTACAVAFDAGNLRPVGEALRKKFPNAEIIFAADDDIDGKVNTGVVKATEAARAIGGKIAIPDFGANRPEKVSDFNDLHQLHGLDAVRGHIANAVDPNQLKSALTADLPGPDTDLIVLRRADQIEMEPIHWLWQDYLAQGALHVMAGQAGTGKTTIALSLAATLSSGGTWPDGSPAAVGEVMLWSGEDRAADTLVPRLAAADARLNRIHVVEAVNTDDGKRPFDPALDLPVLRRQLASLPRVRLLIVDPVVSVVSGDSHKNAEVRRGLQPLVDIAHERRIAVLGISHYSKGTRGRDPLERVSGSIAYGAVARMVLGTGKSTEDDGANVFTRAKCNIAPDGGGFEYTIGVEEIADGITGSKIVWGQPLEGTARDILAGCEVDDDGGGALDDAVYWLKAELADGPINTKVLQKLAKEAGHAWPTVRRAKDQIGAAAEKAGFESGWRWHLPREDDHTRDVDHLRRGNT